MGSFYYLYWWYGHTRVEENWQSPQKMMQLIEVAQNHRGGKRYNFWNYKSFENERLQLLWFLQECHFEFYARLVSLGWVIDFDVSSHSLYLEVF